MTAKSDGHPHPGDIWSPDLILCSRMHQLERCVALFIYLTFLILTHLRLGISRLSLPFTCFDSIPISAELSISFRVLTMSGRGGKAALMHARIFSSLFLWTILVWRCAGTLLGWCPMLIGRQEIDMNIFIYRNSLEPSGRSLTIYLR